MKKDFRQIAHSCPRKNSSPKKPSTNFNDYFTLAQRLTCEQFTSAHPNLFVFWGIYGLSAPGPKFETQVLNIFTEKELKPKINSVSKLSSKLDTCHLFPFKRGIVNTSGSKVMVGRHDDNDIVLPDDTVSKRHGYFFLKANGDIYVQDVGSRNGIYLNGNVIESGVAISAHPTDVVTFGKVPLHILDAQDVYELLMCIAGKFVQSKQSARRGSLRMKDKSYLCASNKQINACNKSQGSSGSGGL